MARIIPKIVDATATFEGVTIDDERWRRIERTYGCKLSPVVRDQLHEATEDYVRSTGFELAAAPVAQSRKAVARLREATAGLAESLNASRIDDAGHYAIRLIGRHFVQPHGRRRRVEASQYLSSILTSFDDACHAALDDLNDPENHGHRPGTRWKQWIQRLTSIVRAHRLPAGVSKDVDKQKTDRPSRFVVLVHELQLALPRQFRRLANSDAALATAISAARRRNREE